MNSEQIFRIDSGNPNGMIFVQAPAVCYTKKGGLWVKMDDCKSSQGWVCLIQETP